MDYYEGEGLTRNLERLGCEREEGEDDWTFRKRVTPDVWLKHDKFTAYEILVGDDRGVWTEDDWGLFNLFNTQNPVPNRMILAGFANGFGADPQKKRRAQQKQ